MFTNAVLANVDVDNVEKGKEIYLDSKEYVYQICVDGYSYLVLKTYSYDRKSVSSSIVQMKKNSTSSPNGEEFVKCHSIDDKDLK